jgi:hypothetical protein
MGMDSLGIDNDTTRTYGANAVGPFISRTPASGATLRITQFQSKKAADLDAVG